MSITVTKISDNIYEFNEKMVLPDGTSFPYVDAYLYIGSSRAAVIDTLQKEKGLYALVREYTDLPLDVLITHGHIDHAGLATGEFAEAGCSIYMDFKDMEMLKGMVPTTKDVWFTPLSDGQEFFLGDRKLVALACEGHTPGSFVFLDDMNKVMFSGDTVGSGIIWMQIEGAVPLARFEVSTRRLLDRLLPLGLEEILVYPGHRNQSPVQLTGQIVKDDWYLTQGILRGTMKGEEKEMNMFGRQVAYCELSHGQMHSFCYDPEQLYFPKKTPQETPEAAPARVKFTVEETRKGSRFMKYMMYTPEEVKNGTAGSNKYPLVIFLHGAGERGTDPHMTLANNGGWVFAADEWQKKHPCFVIAPQVMTDEWWTDDSYMEMLRDLIMNMSYTQAVDGGRIYMTGLSMGGMGTWRFISLYPDLIAAAVPVCGAGDPLAVRKAKNVPVWAVHAADDPVVKSAGYLEIPIFKDLVGSRTLVASLRGAGNPDVKYTEYPEGMLATLGMHPHFSWVLAYQNEEIKEWMFAQNRKDRYQVEMVQPGFYWVEDFNDDSIYVIEGTERALVVDTGLADNDFIGMVKSLTKLPFDLAVTHCHGDHMYHLPKFERYYMSAKDLQVLEMRYTKNPDLSEDEKAAFAKPELIPVNDGDIIDLGGGYEIEVFDLGGHTPGSVCFLDRKRGIMLTGDALGCWMQVNTATTLGYYKEQLKHFLERMSLPQYRDVVMMGGHRKQEGLRTFKYGDRFVPNDLQKVRDMITLCEKLMNEEIEFEPFRLPRNFGEPAYTAHNGSASIVFKKSGLTRDPMDGAVVPLP